MTKIKFDHNITFKRCTKCGKGHDMSAISCSKQPGKYELKKPECHGKLELIQFDEIEVKEYRVIKNE
jgi:hypothetical protein